MKNLRYPMTRILRAVDAVQSGSPSYQSGTQLEKPVPKDLSYINFAALKSLLRNGRGTGLSEEHARKKSPSSFGAMKRPYGEAHPRVLTRYRKTNTPVGYTLPSGRPSKLGRISRKTTANGLHELGRHDVDNVSPDELISPLRNMRLQLTMGTNMEEKGFDLTPDPDTSNNPQLKDENEDSASRQIQQELVDDEPIRSQASPVLSESASPIISAPENDIRSKGDRARERRKRYRHGKSLRKRMLKAAEDMSTEALHATETTLASTNSTPRPETITTQTSHSRSAIPEVGDGIMPQAIPGQAQSKKSKTSASPLTGTLGKGVIASNHGVQVAEIGKSQASSLLGVDNVSQIVTDEQALAASEVTELAPKTQEDSLNSEYKALGLDEDIDGLLKRLGVEDSTVPITLIMFVYTSDATTENMSSSAYTICSRGRNIQIFQQYMHEYQPVKPGQMEPWMEIKALRTLQQLCKEDLEITRIDINIMQACSTISHSGSTKVFRGLNTKRNKYNQLTNYAIQVSIRTFHQPLSWISDKRYSELQEAGIGRLPNDLADQHESFSSRTRNCHGVFDRHNAPYFVTPPPISSLGRISTPGITYLKKGMSLQCPWSCNESYFQARNETLPIPLASGALYMAVFVDASIPSMSEDFTKLTGLSDNWNEHMQKNFRKRLEFVADAYLRLLNRYYLVIRFGKANAVLHHTFNAYLNKREIHASIARKFGFGKHMDMSLAEKNVSSVYKTKDGAMPETLALDETYEVYIGALLTGINSSSVIGDTAPFQRIQDFHLAEIEKITDEYLEFLMNLPRDELTGWPEFWQKHYFNDSDVDPFWKLHKDNFTTIRDHIGEVFEAENSLRAEVEAYRRLCEQVLKPGGVSKVTNGTFQETFDEIPRTPSLSPLKLRNSPHRESEVEIGYRAAHLGQFDVGKKKLRHLAGTENEVVEQPNDEKRFTIINHYLHPTCSTPDIRLLSTAAYDSAGANIRGGLGQYVYWSDAAARSVEALPYEVPDYAMNPHDRIFTNTSIGDEQNNTTEKTNFVETQGNTVAGFAEFKNALKKIGRKGKYP